MRLLWDLYNSLSFQVSRIWTGRASSDEGGQDAESAEELALSMNGQQPIWRNMSFVGKESLTRVTAFSAEL